jgi:hypothetical protein
LPLAAAVLAACSSSNDNPTIPSSIALALSASTATVTPGASTPVTATLTRTNFTGDVQLSAENLPAGVTATFNPATLSGSATSSTVTLAATATTAPAAGTSITIRAKGTGVTDATSAVSLSVSAAAPAYTLTLANPTLSVASGQSGTVNVALARTNFTGGVTLAVSGVPNGATASFAPNPATGNTSVLTVSTGTAAVGTYTLTITGGATGLADRTTTLALTVGQPPATSVTIAFCANDLPVWVGYQSGTSGTWTRASAGANNSYSFDIAGVGGVAIVSPISNDAAANGYATSVVYASAAELQSYGSINSCTPAQTGTKTVSSSVAGLGLTATAKFDLGGGSGSAFHDGPFTIERIPDGVHDLLGARAENFFDVNKLIIRRGLNPANGATLDPVDFNGAEAFAPVTPALTLPGVAATAQTFVVSGFMTGNGSSINLGLTQTTAGTATYVGVPDAKRIAGDLHALLVGVTGASGEARSAFTFVASAVDRSFTLGPALGTSTVTSITNTPYPRLRAQLTSQSAYGSLVSVTYSQIASTTSRSPTDRTVEVQATAAYFGGTPAVWDVSIPDLSAASGFTASWELAPGRVTAIDATAYGGEFLTAVPADGVTFYFASNQGTFNIPAAAPRGIATAAKLGVSPTRRSTARLAEQANRMMKVMSRHRLALGR